MADAHDRTAGRTGAARTESLADSIEDVLIDQRSVGDLVGEDPSVLVVPCKPSGVTERDIVDVEQGLLLPLLVPHLVPGVARVDQNGAYGALGPGDASPMLVAGWIGSGRAEDP